MIKYRFEFVLLLCLHVVFTANVALGAGQKEAKPKLPVAKLIWQAEEIRCPIEDLSKPWMLAGFPQTDDPNLVPARFIDAPRPEFRDTTVIVHFDPKPVFEIVIDPEGHVDRIGLIKGTVNPNFEDLVESVSRWRFSAATYEENPVCSILIVSTPAIYE